MKSLAELVYQITATEIKDLPILLLKVKEYIDNALKNECHVNDLVNDILSYKLVSLFVGVLKQNFTVINVSWKVAVKLSQSLRLMIVCLKSNEVNNEECKALCQSAVSGMLVLAFNLQHCQQMSKSNDEKTAMASYFKDVLKDMLCIVELEHVVFELLVASTVTHELMLKAAKHITFKPLIAFLTACCTSCCGYTGGNLADAKKVKALAPILDEVVYNVSMATDTHIIRSCLMCLDAFGRINPTVLRLLQLRYKGLTTIIKKFGPDHACHGDALKLHELFSEQHDGKVDIHNNAATVIQAYYRGYRTRRLLRAVNVAFSKFQAIFRQRLAEKVNARLEKSLNCQMKLTASVERKRIHREENQRQFDMVALMPAGNVESYFSKRQQDAASKIQASWKGFIARKSYYKLKHQLKEDSAAVTIQRHVRKWLADKKVVQENLLTNEPLSDQQMEQYQSIIDDYINKYKTNHAAANEDQMQNMLDLCHTSLTDFYTTMPSLQRQIQHCNNLAAQMQISTSLIGYSKLCDISEDEGRMLKSSSRQVALQANQMHQKVLKNLNEPSWEKTLRDLEHF